MKGFDPKWRDVPHFVMGITREIWEDRAIASLTHRYAPGLIVRSPASVVVDNARVIAATMATLAEFPDRELLGEDVI
ncbi:MAG: nuclear transport factor 2 family protein, partial [Rhodobacteraceae bacterium]|nr:nuclear transport factor 2 family protein [Paracoccaceae bacterium]